MKKNKACIQSIREITPDGQMAGQTDAQAPLLALSTSSDGHLSIYAPDKFFIAKIKKGSTGDRVMVLAFCNSLHGPLSLYQVSFIYLQYF